LTVINREQNEEIDILALYAKGSHVGWNKWLSKCQANRDVLKLISVRKGLQINMDKIAKQKLNTEKVNVLFIRLTRSIEKTLKNIFREMYPSPCDDPLLAKESGLARLAEKRKRDAEFERFLRRHGF